MSSLEQIDMLYKEAQEDIISGNPEYTRTVIWPKIKSAIYEYPGFSPEDCRKLIVLILDYLNKLGFSQSEGKGHIQPIKELTTRIQSSEEGPPPPLWHPW